jgi:hypothetical protein
MISRVSNRRHCRFGCQALAPLVSGQSPANFQSLSGRHKTTETNRDRSFERAGGQCPATVTMLLPACLFLNQEPLGFRVIPGSAVADMLHDRWITGKGEQCLKVQLMPAAKDQSLRLNCRLVEWV